MEGRMEKIHRDRLGRSYLTSMTEGINVWRKAMVDQRPYVRKMTHSALNLNALSGHSLFLLLGGVPANPRCQLWPPIAVLPVSRDRCSPDKHYIGNV